jgi:hypothetical protein
LIFFPPSRHKLVSPGQRLAADPIARVGQVAATQALVKRNRQQTMRIVMLFCGGRSSISF